tara:strand:+ start:828 stop:1691 length:864 start_codon:yes stop_codon:yes gene_type:complete
MNKILVTGSNGQLGKTFKYISEEFPKYNFHFLGLPEFDLTDKNELNEYFTKTPVNFIINTAAYTEVDKAEEEPEEAKISNINIVKNLCELSYKYTFKLIHISSDYVFDGTATRPYKPYDTINPKGVYAESKAAAEMTILKANIDAWIVRTSWLFSPFGHNFLKTIIQLLKSKKEINVVADQIGVPTYSIDLAKFILNAISQKLNFKGSEIYHFTNSGSTTWYDFACTIKNEINADCGINPVLTKDYPTKAKRPKYSVLSCEKTKKEFNLSINSWKLALKDCLNNLNH